jgi:hypothetical protein
MAVAIYTTRANDVALATIGILLGSLGLWGGCVGMWHATPADFQGVRGEGFVRLLFSIFGPQGMAVAAGLLGVWASCLGVGGIWRLLRPGPAVVADGEGIKFHPSIGPKIARWIDVRSIRWVRRAPGEIEINLNLRTWSFWNWTTSKRIRLNHVAIGLSWKEAAMIVRAMRQAREF